MVKCNSQVNNKFAVSFVSFKIIKHLVVILIFIYAENDIDTISFDMEKNNVSLPEFQKINDLLAECLTNDKNTLNIEINNLNQAIFEEVSSSRNIFYSFV